MHRRMRPNGEKIPADKAVRETYQARINALHRAEDEGRTTQVEKLKKDIALTESMFCYLNMPDQMEIQQAIVWCGLDLQDYEKLLRFAEYYHLRVEGLHAKT